MSLCDFVAPLEYNSDEGVGSTDVGDVSWVTPTVQARVTQGKSPAAHKGMVHAAKVMASTAVNLLLNPDKLIEAKEIHRKKLKINPYICPIPKDKKPPVESQFN